MNNSSIDNKMNKKPRVSIEYCPKCRWMLRASWLCQELLTTFEQDIGEVALIPGDVGVFVIKVNEELIWDRKQDGGFPEAKVLKQRVRDIIAPQKSLGHSDVKKDDTIKSNDDYDQTFKNLEMETTTLSFSSHTGIQKMQNLDQDQLYLEAIAASASATGVLPEEYLQDLAATGSLSLLDQLHQLTNFFMKSNDTFDSTSTTTNNHGGNVLSAASASAC